MTATDSPDLRGRIGRELQRVQTRARNGLRQVGGNASSPIAVTPKQEVWRQDNVVLYRYDAGVGAGTPPLVLVHSLVTKPAVLDLRPGSSLVEDLLAAGHDVFLVDWGVPEPVDAHNGLDTYADEYLPRAVRAAISTAGSDDVTLIGYCLGGLLALLAVAGNPGLPIRSLVMLATPAEFRDLSTVTTMIAEDRLVLDDFIDQTGNVPASLVKEGLRIVKPTLPLATYSSLWQSLADDEALTAHNALITWSDDHIPFPGKAFRELAIGYIRDGAPLHGTAPVGRRLVRMSDVRCPVLSVVGDKDYMVPPEASAPFAEVLTNAEFTTLALPAGHAGLFIGRQARTKCVPSIVAWLAEHS